MKIIKRQSEVTSGQIFSKTPALFFQDQLGTIVNLLQMIISGKYPGYKLGTRTTVDSFPALK